MTKYAKLGPRSNSPTIARFVKMACPRYRKRSVRVFVRSTASLYGRYWSDGSKEEYKLCNEYGNTVKGFPNVNPLLHDHTSDEFEIPSRQVVVNQGTFAGKISTLNLYIHPDCEAMVHEHSQLEDE